ncbi:MAG: BatA domain-containing protein, partial [Phaeodactylibacter sp.]|nr:BatA domain-containing protein [Phaeodactylibacter sp.]
MFGLFDNIRFVNPELLFLLLLIPMAAVWYFLRHQKRYPLLRMPSLTPVQETTSWRARLQFLLPLFRALAFAAMIIALARPQEILKKENIKAEGIDIFMVMDLSNSMLARDFNPNRLEVSKKVALDFVSKRPYDRLGLAAFSGEAFTQCP